MAFGLMKKEKGFTLIEVLVVLAILAVIAVIATVNVSSTLKKQRLEAAANQLQSFIENAATYARERSRGVFVWLHRDVALGGGGNWWYCYLIEDTNRNDVLEFQITNPGSIPPGAGTAADGDTYINSEKVGLPGGVALPYDILLPEVSEVDPTAWGGQHNWPVHPNGTDYFILCDPRSVVFNPNPPFSQILQPTTISLTHEEMINGNLHPRIRYDIIISPLWHTKLDRVLY